MQDYSEAHRNYFSTYLLVDLCRAGSDIWYKDCLIGETSFHDKILPAIASNAKPIDIYFKFGLLVASLSLLAQVLLHG